MSANTLLAAAPTYQRETLQSVRDAGIERLLSDHKDEIAHYPDIEFAPDWDFYQRSEELSSLAIYTAREDGELVGYSVHLVAPNKHYRHSIQAIQDVIYVAPSHRGTLVGWRLIRFADKDLKAAGVQVSYHHAKDKHPALGKLLERLGYERIDALYGRRLDRS